MPVYEFVDKRTGKAFTKQLAIKDMDLPLKNPFVDRVISAPNVGMGIGLDYGGNHNGYEASKRMADNAILKAQNEIRLGVMEKSQKTKMTFKEVLTAEKLERLNWRQKVGKLIDN